MNGNAFEAWFLASDLSRVHEIYTDFFAGLTAVDWKLPPEDGDEAWNLRQVVAHLGALTELGQESVEAALRGEAITFLGLSSRFEPLISPRSGGDLEAALLFRISGAGRGNWRLVLSPHSPSSGAGTVANADLTLSFRDTAEFCRMFTGRINLLGAFITGRFRLRGNLRLFLRFRSLFSVDAPA